MNGEPDNYDRNSWKAKQWIKSNSGIIMWEVKPGGRRFEEASINVNTDNNNGVIEANTGKAESILPAGTILYWTNRA